MMFLSNKKKVKRILKGLGRKVDDRIVKMRLGPSPQLSYIIQFSQSNFCKEIINKDIRIMPGYVHSAKASASGMSW